MNGSLSMKTKNKKVKSKKTKQYFILLECPRSDGSIYRDSFLLGDEGGTLSILDLTDAALGSVENLGMNRSKVLILALNKV